MATERKLPTHASGAARACAMGGAPVRKCGGVDVNNYWIKEEDYPALLQLFDDADKMPPNWKEWLKMAEEMEQGLKAYGHVVLRRLREAVYPRNSSYVFSLQMLLLTRSRRVPRLDLP